MQEIQQKWHTKSRILSDSEYSSGHCGMMRKWLNTFNPMTQWFFGDQQLCFLFLLAILGISSCLQDSSRGNLQNFGTANGLQTYPLKQMGPSRSCTPPKKKPTIRDSKRWLWLSKGSKMYTPRKFNIAPENGWLEDYFPAYLHLFPRAMLNFQSVYLKCWLFYTMIFQLIWWCEVETLKQNCKEPKIDLYLASVELPRNKKHTHTHTHQTALAESLSVTRIPKPGFCCCIVWGDDHLRTYCITKVGWFFGPLYDLARWVFLKTHGDKGPTCLWNHSPPKLDERFDVQLKNQGWDLNTLVSSSTLWPWNPFLRDFIYTFNGSSPSLKCCSTSFHLPFHGQNNFKNRSFHHNLSQFLITLDHHSQWLILQ